MKMTTFKVVFDNLVVVELKRVSWKRAFRMLKRVAMWEESHGKIYVVDDSGNAHFVREVGSNTVYFPNGYKVIGAEVWNPNGGLYMACRNKWEAVEIAESLKPARWEDELLEDTGFWYDFV